MGSRPTSPPPALLPPSPRGSSLHVGVDRPRHDAMSSQSPVASRRKREADAGFPRSELWSWSMGASDTSSPLKDDVIENMLRECSMTVGIGSMSATPSLPSTSNEQRRLHHHLYHLHTNSQQFQALSASQAQQQSTPSGSRRKLPSRGFRRLATCRQRLRLCCGVTAAAATAAAAEAPVEAVRAGGGPTSSPTEPTD